ncbi:MAG: cupin domain-containing protein [Burkholderiales bacterium]|nr:cupin domain-containing protein [Burkholderiales bacterium]
MKKKSKSRAKRAALIRNVIEVPWQEFPGHYGGALSKALVRPETAGSRLIDYRVSCYQPMANVALHKHKAQEQVYHVLEGEGMMEMDGKRRVVRKHDVIYIPPGVEHGISNTGLGDLTFIVATTPADDE